MNTFVLSIKRQRNSRYSLIDGISEASCVDITHVFKYSRISTAAKLNVKSMCETLSHKHESPSHNIRVYLLYLNVIATQNTPTTRPSRISSRVNTFSVAY